MEDKVTQYIIDKLLMGEENLKRLKVEAARKFSSNDIIKNTKILENFPKEKLTDKIRELLLKKPMRTGSGVTQLVLSIVSWMLIFTLIGAIIGIPLIIGMWIWGLVTGIQLIKEAE